VRFLSDRFTPARHTDAIVVVSLVLATLAVGIAIDAGGEWWAQGAVSAWTWMVLACIAYRSTPAHRVELVVCVALATLGELFLKDVWGLYSYRLGNLPLFIPPGHAIVYAASVSMSRAVPQWLPAAVVIAFGVYVCYSAVRGFDTFGLFWFAAFVGYVVFSANRRLCAMLFLFALAIEVYGTGLGGWRYFTVEPWFGLTTTNPPMWVGAIYCTLETLVRVLAGSLRYATVVSDDPRCRGTGGIDNHSQRSPVDAGIGLRRYAGRAAAHRT
jgi:hypothetical protein